MLKSKSLGKNKKTDYFVLSSWKRIFYFVMQINLHYKIYKRS